MMRYTATPIVCLCGLAILLTISGCRTTRPDAASGTVQGNGEARRVVRGRQKDPIRRVVCLFDQKPWLNLDAAGDRDPEGVRFKVFLVPEGRMAVLRGGKLKVEMYRISRKSSGEVERTLISDWIIPTSEIQQVKSKMLGMGYHLRLRWARKDTAGNEVELITHHEDSYGRVVRSGTKRLRVPKYNY